MFDVLIAHFNDGGDGSEVGLAFLTTARQGANTVALRCFSSTRQLTVFRYDNVYHLTPSTECNTF